MEFSEEAKREIEKNLSEVVRNINVDGRERAEIVNELRSTYYEAAEGEARARGSDVVSVVDARSARASISSPRETAESFMKSYADTLRRAGFWSRLVAFVIDNLAIFALSMIVMAPLFGLMLLMGMPMQDEAANQAWFDSLSLTGAVTFGIVAFAAAVSVMVVIFGYYIVLEGHFGYTPGKYVMGLRVLQTDGTKIGYKEAILRNLSKYINNLIVIDTLIMLVFFYREKQRGFDRIANTMVVRIRS
ncbi:MAG: RDD family protein [Methanocella sp. PtaU1.Bin125]|nr:MAG: RDD family protein [Methanocella sp. PtaU1.Bin125]